MAQFEIDKPQQAGCRDDPGELIPVEEWESEERRGGPRVDLREAEGEVGQEQQEQPPLAVLGF